MYLQKYWDEPPSGKFSESRTDEIYSVAIIFLGSSTLFPQLTALGVTLKASFTVEPRFNEVPGD